MSNAPQPDLFSVLAAPAAAGIAMLPQPPRPPMAPLFPVPPSLEWEKILRASPHGDNVTIMAEERCDPGGFARGRGRQTCHQP